MSISKVRSVLMNFNVHERSSILMLEQANSSQAYKDILYNCVLPFLFFAEGSYIIVMYLWTFVQIVYF